MSHMHGSNLLWRRCFFQKSIDSILMQTGFKKEMCIRDRSIVLSGDDEIEIEILSRREQNDEMACVSYDGDTTAELAVGDLSLIHI